MRKHNYYPAALNVRGKKCLVIGDDKEADEKSQRLAEAGADVALVTPLEFSMDDITDQFLVVLCVKSDPDLTKAVAKTCRERRVLLCAVDQPDHCDVVNVSIFDKGRLRMTIGTGGAAPAVSKRIRMGLERSFREEPIDAFLDDLAALRERLVKEWPNSKDRIPKLLEAVEGFDFHATVKFPPVWLKQRKESKK